MSTATRQRRVVTTADMQRLIEMGATVRLPAVERPDDAALSALGADAAERVGVDREDNPVSSVRYLRDDEVQCISVDHEDHLYVTDDMIPTHNTSNIVFLKSTDDSMIDTLVKMSGVHHVGRTDSKTVRKDAGSFFNVVSVESDVSMTMTAKEEPVISYNDFASLAERNSIVLRAGDSPIWNRNETILPMSWRLFGPKGENTVHSNSEYSLQTIPTLSTASEFDVRLNQPNFQWMLEKRLLQATKADRAREIYMDAFKYDDRAMMLLDVDVLSEDLMGIMDAMILQDKTGIGDAQGAVEGGDTGAVTDMEEFVESSIGNGASGSMMEHLEEQAPAEENEDAILERKRYEAKKKALIDRRYCGGAVQAADIAQVAFSEEGGLRGIDHSMDLEVLEAYRRARSYIDRDTKHFSIGQSGSLMSADGRTPYITKIEETAARAMLVQDLAEEGGEEWAEDELDEMGSYYVHVEFYTYLASLPDWSGIAEGEFERAMTAAVRRREADSY